MTRAASREIRSSTGSRERRPANRADAGRRNDMDTNRFNRKTAGQA
jgi:hypothetical protein